MGISVQVIDANVNTDFVSERFDVLIFGSGIAGMLLANKLVNAGLKVCIADSGEETNLSEAQKLNDIIYDADFTYRENFQNRLRQIGGTSNVWAGRLFPFPFQKEHDFEWGSLARILPNYFEKTLFDFGFKVIPDGFNDFDKPVTFLEGSQFREITAYWAKEIPKFNIKSNIVKKLLANPLFYMVKNLTLVDFEKFDGRRLKSVVCKNILGEKIELNINRLVIACGGIENARILLYNKEVLAPFMQTSFANVGAYFMDHPKITHGEVIFRSPPRELEDFIGTLSNSYKFKKGILSNECSLNQRLYFNLVPSRTSIEETLYSKSANVYKRFNKIGFSHSFLSTAQKMPDIRELIYLLEPWEIIPHRLSYLLQKTKRRIFKTPSIKYKIVTYVEMAPEFENRIELTSKLDGLGVPIPKLKVRINPSVKFSVIEALNAFGKALLHNDLGKLKINEKYLSDYSNYYEASHHMGTTRYSAIKEKAVVDINMKLFGLDNIFICGSSVFPTSNIVNPSFMIGVISNYLADIIKDEWRRIN